MSAKENFNPDYVHLRGESRPIGIGSIAGIFYLRGSEMKYPVILILFLLAGCSSKSSNPASSNNSTGISINGEWRGTNVYSHSTLTTDLKFVQSGENVTGSGYIFNNIQVTAIVGVYDYPNLSLIIATESGQASFTGALSDSITLSGTMLVPGYSSTFPALLKKQ